MFCEIHQALQPIIKLSKHTDYSDNVKSFVSKLSYKQFEHVLRQVNKQSILQYKEYAVYKQNYNTLKLELISNVSNTDSNEFHTTFDTTEEVLLLNTLSPQCLTNYILDNSHLKYIFIPINYMNDTKNSGHIALLMFDNNAKTVYMIDPNGKSTYFDNIFHEYMNQYIEHMLSQFIGELNKYGLVYKYIYANMWNRNTICINKHYNNKYIGTGHCVILSLMIANLIVVCNTSPKDIYDLFNNMFEDEILFIIKEYSLGVYNMLK